MNKTKPKLTIKIKHENQTIIAVLKVKESCTGRHIVLEGTFSMRLDYMLKVTVSGYN